MNNHVSRTLTRTLSAILAIVLVLLAFPFLLPAEPAAALDYTDIQTKLNTWQYYFCRTVMSLAQKDAYDTGVLASITAGQFFYEGGCAGAPISIIAQNHYGIKAYSNWTGKVYDDRTHRIYQSYTDFVNIVGTDYARNASLWRAYDTLDAGISDHSALLLGEAKYQPVLAAKDYKEAARAILAAGYAGGTSYATNLINYIERYGFDQLDQVTTDENGVYGMVMSASRTELNTGDELQLEATAYPQPESPVEVTWASTCPEVASVDQNGNVTANRQGYALITATYNNKEACCIVCVDSNAYLMDTNLAVFSQPDTDSDSIGKLVRGQPLKVNSTTVYTAEDGTQFYAVSASVGTGTLVSGYARADKIYTGTEVRLSIGTPATILQLQAGDEQTIPVEVYAEELQGKTLVWESSDPSVVTVDQEGAICALQDGVAVISIRIDDTTALTITVYVGSVAYDTLIAFQAVYLRSAPSSGAKILGTIAVNQEVKLIGEPDSGWYRVLAIIGGQALEGYSYARYFIRPGENPPDISNDPSSSTPPPESSSESSSENSSESLPESSDQSAETSSGGHSSFITYDTGEVYVDDALNVRDTASTSGNRVARLHNGDEVIILETVTVSNEPIYRLWYRISFRDGGTEKQGFVAAEFIRLTGTIQIPIDVPSDPIASAVYPISESFVTGISAGTTRAQFAEVFEYPVRICREDGSELAQEDRLQTGDTVQVLYEGAVRAELTVVVRGDINRDGKVNAQDYIQLKRAVLGITELTGAPLQAARVTGRDRLSAADYIRLKRAVLGITQL